MSGWLAWEELVEITWGLTTDDPKLPRVLAFQVAAVQVMHHMNQTP